MDDLTYRDRAHLAALESTYPGWCIDIVDGTWYATRRTPPTDKQKAAGIHHRITCTGPMELATALAQQAGILSLTRSL